ncbi:MAG: DUF4956 domain-containing protein [Clostridia bacterium]
MSIQDVIKNSFLELDTFAGSFTAASIVSMAIGLIISLLFGMFICFIYDKFYRGVVYNRSFAITLVGMTVLTTMVTLAISTNIVISLGMVGALSIVRYRTAVKEPLDLLYLFWAITTGITAGAKMYPLCIFAAIVMVIILLVYNRRGNNGQVSIMVVHYSGDMVVDAVRRAMVSTKYRIKSRSLSGDVCEMAVEVFAKNQSMAFVEKVRAIDGVEDVTLIQYDGEYHD